MAYIEYVYATLVDEEALEKALDDDQALSQDQHDGVDPGAPSMEYGEESELGQKGKGEQNEVHEQRYQRQRQQAAEEQRVVSRVTQEIVDA